jgi:hypothetical protein
MKATKTNISTIIFFLFVITLLSCKKDTGTNQNPLLGSWAFTNEYSIRNYLDNSDSINITFDNTNHYTFKEYNIPIDKGNFTMSTDSSFVLVPADTSYSSFYSLTHFTTPYAYQYRIYFASDKYYFSMPNTKQLIIKRVWSLVNTPNTFFNESFNFKLK